VIIKVEPLAADVKEDFIIEDKTTGGSIPKQYLKPAMDGIREAAQSGVFAGFPVVRFKASLIDGSYHEVDSSELAFKIAGSMAFKDAIQQGGPILLEPFMRVEVVVPEQYAGDVISDLSGRRSDIAGMETRTDGVASIQAHSPLGNMFGYMTNLRNMSQGRGSFTMEFEQYRPAPESVVESVLRGG
jgi:elongation factor G